jgi:peptidoglycan/LPS O-acetylase OafA/YrhL
MAIAASVGAGLSLGVLLARETGHAPPGVGIAPLADAWALLLGCLLALTLTHGVISRSVSQTCSIVGPGAILVVLAASGLNGEPLFHPASARITVSVATAALLVALVAGSAGWLQAPFEWRPMQWLGRRSSTCSGSHRRCRGRSP